MTTQDLIEAGVILQGHITVYSREDDENVTEFDGDGEELAGCDDQLWYYQQAIAYIYPNELEEGVIIELAA